MKLLESEARWLSDFLNEVEKRFPGTVEEVSIYGSKAREDSKPESDLDVLLIVNSDSGGLKSLIRDAGYLLAADGNAVPSIVAYTRDEWDNRKESGSGFRASVEQDAVRVL
ncbi:MAG: nucleotidyltransferase domain-containing protein [Candidatus Omnitrophica bacterium]|nr:nucleotidyltransferase domain-containing protein [Candidatus Omnitrophota bacterium]